jgi:hypothetical protein
MHPDIAWFRRRHGESRAAWATRLTLSWANCLLIQNAAYTSKFYWDSDNFLPQKSYVLVNASLTLVPAVARNTFVRLWGDNITGEKYYVFELPVAGGAGNLAHPG